MITQACVQEIVSLQPQENLIGADVRDLKGRRDLFWEHENNVVCMDTVVDLGGVCCARNPPLPVGLAI